MIVRDDVLEGVESVGDGVAVDAESLGGARRT
jgi:hypothetical protein